MDTDRLASIDAMQRRLDELAKHMGELHAYVRALEARLVALERAGGPAGERPSQLADALKGSAWGGGRD